MQSGEMVALLYDNLVQFDVDAVNLVTGIVYPKVDPRGAHD